MPAFDMVEVDHPYYTLGGWQNRAFAVPPAMGVDYRVVNGYVYISPNPVTDPAKIAERAEYFEKRAGHYFQNWDELYAGWRTKMEALNREVESIEVPDLPEYEPDEVVFGEQNLSNIDLLRAYSHTLRCAEMMWQHHFEFLLLGYGAYLTFAEFLRAALPDIPDQHISQMVAGIDVVLFRADTELRRLARAGDRDGRGRRLRRGPLARRDRRGAGRAATPAALARRAREDQGPLVQHGHRRRPLPLLRQLARRPEHPVRVADRARRRRSRRARRSSARPRSSRGSATAWRRSTARCSTRRRAAAFQELLGLSRTVFPYVEEHKFYCDYWFQSRFFNKVREFGALLAKHGFIEEGEDIFHLSRHEAMEALEELSLTWSTGGPRARARTTGRRSWRAASELLERLGEWTPPPALGRDARGGERPDRGDALGHHAAAPAGVGAARRRAAS